LFSFLLLPLPVTALSNPDVTQAADCHLDGAI